MILWWVSCNFTPSFYMLKAKASLNKITLLLKEEHTPFPSWVDTKFPIFNEKVKYSFWLCYTRCCLNSNFMKFMKLSYNELCPAMLLRLFFIWKGSAQKFELFKIMFSKIAFWFLVLFCFDLHFFFFMVLGRVYRAINNTTSIMEIGLKT